MDERDRIAGRPAGIRVRRAAVALGAAAALALSACGGSGVHINLSATPGGQSPVAGGSPLPNVPLPSANPANPGLLANEPVVQIVQRVAPAVVNVTTRVESPGSFLGGSQVGKDVGTGFIIRSDGIIATNFHVVEGALNIKVALPPPDGRVFDARAIGGDSDHDLAVLKISAAGLPTVPLGDSSKVQLGEQVIALGYALALLGGPTVTSGIISSLARTVQATDPNANNGQGLTRTYQDVVQTDAAINPGNSGGPLIDLDGNVIGINTAGNSQAQSIGFSIAIDAAKPIIDQAIAHPSAPSPYLGVTTETVNPGVASQFGLGATQGAVVLALAPNGPAEVARIRVGDVIVSFGGQAVSTSDDLGKDILAHKPGDHVAVGVVHQDGTRSTVTVTLGVRPLPTP